MTTPRRRLNDKVIEAFEQACDEGDLDIAQELFWALELALSRKSGPGEMERRRQVDYIGDASARLEALKHARRLDSSPPAVAPTVLRPNGALPEGQNS